jgi:uncharacterized BrkB/YihY/UPF0761 family membrane protein
MNILISILRSLFRTIYILFAFAAAVLAYMYSEEVFSYIEIEPSEAKSLILGFAVFCFFFILYLILPRFGLDQNRPK